MTAVAQDMWDRYQQALLRQPERIQGIALLALADGCLVDDDLFGVRSRGFVEPGAQRALLQDDVAVPRNQAERFEQCPSVTLDREALFASQNLIY